LQELELLKIELEVISSGKKEKETPIIQVRLLKRRRRFFAWWSMEGK